MGSLQIEIVVPSPLDIAPQVEQVLGAAVAVTKRRRSYVLRAAGLGIHATQYYTWQKQLFENGAVAFERRPNQANQRRQEDAREKKIAQLEEKRQRKNEVVAELLKEHVQ